MHVLNSTSTIPANVSPEIVHELAVGTDDTLMIDYLLETFRQSGNVVEQRLSIRPIGANAFGPPTRLRQVDAEQLASLVLGEPPC